MGCMGCISIVRLNVRFNNNHCKGSNMGQIKYRKLNKYKYQLVELYKIKLPFKVPELIVTPFIRLSVGGMLVVRKGYSWDGSSCSPDTPRNLRASLVHDCLYQLISENHLPLSYRIDADNMLRDILIADGFKTPNLWYRAVRLFGHLFLKQNGKQDKVYIAPPTIKIK